MKAIALLAVSAVLAVGLTGCSSSPEESLASDICAVLTDYKEAPEGEGDVFATENALSDLALQGQADGVDMSQVSAKIELECTDAFAYFLNDQQELLDILEELQDSLNE